MARSINEIQESIIEQINSDVSLNTLDILTDNEKSSLNDSLTSSSKVALWRMFVYIVAVSFWTIEKLFDTLKEEIEDLLRLLKPHKPSWYRQKVLNFQFGHELNEKDYYDNTNDLSPLELAKARVVKYAAVIEINSILYIKVAGEKEGIREKLSDAEEAALLQYIKLIRDAGVKVVVVNRDADSLRLEIDAYYNPLEIDANGARLDGKDGEPLQNKLRQYLKEFEFNGELVLTKLTDQLQKVKGIEMPVIKAAYYKFGKQQDWNLIDETYRSDAGHMKIDDDDLTIKWIPRDVS